VAQVTLYLPDDLAERLKREARRQRKSFSAFVAERLAGKPSSDRRDRLKALFGSCSLAEVEALPIDDVEGL
jgi:predicted CopG family antitoxin